MGGVGCGARRRNHALSLSQTDENERVGPTLLAAVGLVSVGIVALQLG